MLESLETVKILEVATGLRVLLDANGPMTVGQLLWHRPIQGGLEELVAHTPRWSAWLSSGRLHRMRPRTYSTPC